MYQIHSSTCNKILLADVSTAVLYTCILRLWCTCFSGAPAADERVVTAHVPEAQRRQTHRLHGVRELGDGTGQPQQRRVVLEEEEINVWTRDDFLQPVENGDVLMCTCS